MCHATMTPILEEEKKICHATMTRILEEKIICDTTMTRTDMSRYSDSTCNNARTLAHSLHVSFQGRHMTDDTCVLHCGRQQCLD